MVYIYRAFLSHNAMLARYMLLSIFSSVHHAHIVSKWLNLGSRKQLHTIA